MRLHVNSEGFKAGTRFEGDAQRRFAGKKPHADRAAAALAPRHPALIEGRSIFPSTVKGAAEVPRVFVSGHNNVKLGAVVAKGAWRGMPIYHLTLEERATCPRSCAVWSECFGNAMHLARRHRLDRALLVKMSWEIVALGKAHPQGFVIRLHTLGDFATLRYAAWWSVYLRWCPQLHIMGFTAQPDGSPQVAVIERMNARHPDRCAIRFSRAVPTGQGFEATTIWRQPQGDWVPEGIICPAQTGKTACCATCGLCWAPAAFKETIVFIGHGKRAARGPRI